MASRWMATLVVVGAVATMAAGSADGSTSLPGSATSGIVHQIGTYDYLNTPNYDGLAPVGRIDGPGRIGLGTFSRIDGEMVVIDGSVYRVGTDGTPRVVSPGRRTPFAQTVRFRPQVQRRVPAATACSDITTLVDRWVGTGDGIVAVRMEGRFRQLQMRSVPRQSKPYLSLAGVVGQETVFDLDGRRATLVGFRTGPDLAGVAPVGTHLHGLTRDRSAGGHTLSCVTGANVTLWAQVADGVRIASRSGGRALG